MFEGLTKKQAKAEIMDAISEYFHKFHNNEVKIGGRIPYASRVYDQDEMMNLVDASLDFWLTSGKYTAEFEENLASFLNVRYCCFVNSGSSANLLAFSALTSPLLGNRRILPGDEVITVACGFPTTVTPILQYGAVPVFVDITLPTYNIDVSLLESAYSDKTKAVVIAHTLGNPFDIDAVKSFCDTHNLWLIEDNCDALGSKYKYCGEERYTGTVGDIGTSSFYPPHHMTTGEGGATYTNNPLLYKAMLSIRDWGRDCSCPSGKDDTCGCRFTSKYGQLPYGYDHKYVYSHFGYNLKATDLQAAIGCAQIEKLPDFIKRRQHNHDRFSKKLSAVEDKLILHACVPGYTPSWFGYAISCKNADDKNKVVSHLESNGIQTRMLFAGNLIRHPCFDLIRGNDRYYRVVGSLDNTDFVVGHTFWVGVYPGMTDEIVDFICEKIVEAVR